MSHVHVSWVTDEKSCGTHGWVMPNTWTSHVRYEWVLSHTIESCHHIRIRHVIHANESCHTCLVRVDFANGLKELDQTRTHPQNFHERALYFRKRAQLVSPFPRRFWRWVPKALCVTFAGVASMKSPPPQPIFFWRVHSIFTTSRLLLRFLRKRETIRSSHGICRCGINEKSTTSA